MDFNYNDTPAARLENEPYWKQYGWMNKLGLNGPRSIVFALIFERDCTCLLYTSPSGLCRGHGAFRRCHE